MAAQVHDVGRMLIGWMVAIAAGIQTFGQVILAAVTGDRLAFVVWATATVMLVVLAASIESVKRYLGG